ncbi:MAG: glucans biosynthesis glucosyltransferase MdoH [Pseudomonadota bacterium]
MTDYVQTLTAESDHGDVRTPTGMQSARVLRNRRLLVLALNLAGLAALLAGLSVVFGAGGWSVTDIVILACVMVGAPWTIMGFWNAVIGLWLMHGARDGLAAAAPHLDAPSSPIREKTAIAMFLRNEPPAPSLARVAAMRRALDAAGVGQWFDFYILSDSDDPDVIAEERRLFELHREAFGAGAVYRVREDNAGFKSGNLQDFLDRWGDGYTYFLPLDTDSLMSAEAIIRLVEVMQVHPRLGILQSLVVGTPATSAFARLFQFGMRHGMRSFTMGAAWWHGDCGPYWGHNALIRTEAFRTHCKLPKLPRAAPLGGHILSHDQVEAVMMRRAGYEVRVLPLEGESWEANPPTLLDFTKRDLRWCQGNMQYWRILGWKGLKPMSRFQIFAAIMMYFGAPAWMLMTASAAVKVAGGDLADVDLAFGVSMFFIMVAMSLFPKIAGWIDVALRPGGVASYGGRRRFIAGALTETAFSLLLAPVVALRITLFLIGLVFGRSVIWGAQNRDPYKLNWGDACRGLWPQTAFGLGLTALLAAASPATLPWALPVLTGLVLSIPFAVATASPALGRWSVRRGLCAIPEDFTDHPMIAAARSLPPAPGSASPARAA